MAWRYLVTRRREGPVAAVTLLCTGGVLVGVLALVVVLALMDGLHGDIQTRLLGSNAHVVVRPSVAGRTYREADVSRLAAEIAAVPGVVASAPFASEWGLLRSELVPSGVPVEMRGIDPEAEDRVTGLGRSATRLGWERLLADARAPLPRAPVDDDAPLTLDELAPPDVPAILLGETVAHDLGVVPGDVVRLLAVGVDLSALGPTQRSRAFVVAGLIKTGVYEYDRTWAACGLRRLRDTSLGGIDGIEVAVSDPMRAPDVAGRLRAALGDEHDVTDWTTTLGRLFAAQKWERLLMVIAVGLIALVAGFNIFTILTLNVTARVADIGILAAMGASASAITRIFLWMGLMIGGAGTLLGLACGAVIATVLDRNQLIRLDPSVYLVEHVPFEVHAGDLAFVALGMLLVSFLATLAPSRSAARLDPVVALRNA